MASAIMLVLTFASYRIFPGVSPEPSCLIRRLRASENGTGRKQGESLFLDGAQALMPSRLGAGHKPKGPKRPDQLQITIPVWIPKRKIVYY